MRKLISVLVVGAAAVWLTACEEERGGRPANGGAFEQNARPQEENEPSGPGTTPRQRLLEDRVHRIQRDP
jgi:hypothetical protein